MNDEQQTNSDTKEEVQKATSFRRSKNNNSPANGQRLIYNPSRRNAGMGLAVPQNILDDIDDNDNDEIEEKIASEEENKEDSEIENTESEGQTNQNQTSENAPSTNLGQKERTKVNGNAIMSTATFVKNFKRNLIIGGIIVLAIIVIFLFILVGSFGSAAEGNHNSYCAADSEGDVISFLDNWEGKSNALTCNNGAGYAGQNIGDGTVTIGSGVTNYVIRTDYMADFIRKNGWESYFLPYGSNFQISIGTCIPKEIVEKLKLRAIEVSFAAPIDTYAEKYNVELTQYQKDALTVFNYNLGAGHTEALIRAYAEGGYEGLWNAMKGYTCATLNGVYQCNHLGLMRRRKAEFALFVTGDYSDQGKFYSRNVNNYDYYDSEGVMSRQLICNDSAFAGDFYAPLDNGFYCSEGYHWRSSHPVDGTAKQHYGLDLGNGGQAGKTVYAVLDGEVSYVVDSYNCSSYKNPSCNIPACGNQINITHPDGTTTIYCHLLHNSAKVSRGDTVHGGQPIAQMGTTGSSTGPHLHFGLKLANGQYADPYDYFRDYFDSFFSNQIMTGNPSRCE